MTETIKATMDVIIEDEAIDSIVSMSFDRIYSFGCYCECVDFVKPDGTLGIMGEYGQQQISLGGSIIWYDDESDDKWELTKEKFINGIKLLLADEKQRKHVPLDYKNGKLYVSPIHMDGIDADAVIQYALFGEWVFC